MIAELRAYGRGMIVAIWTDKDPFEALERAEEVLHDLRLLVSRARVEKSR